VLISPSGYWYENDDHDGSAERSRIETVADQSGEWVVYATSLSGGEVGDYRLSIDRTPSSLPGQRFERGTLAAGDEALPGGEWADRLTFSGEAGGYAWIDLRSSQFDPYLVVHGPGGESWENDDFEGSLERSVLGLALPQAGDYEVVVTSAFAGETGAWDLTLRQDLRPEPARRVEEGELAEGDERLRSGELVDEFRFEATAGQQLRLVLASDDFDTYLILVDPRGGHVESDDDANGDSSIGTRLTTPGTHRVLVTSYEPAETGAYTLSIDLGEVRSAELERLPVGESRQGRLEAGDDEVDGAFLDRYAFRAEAGTAVEIVLSASDFDTYLWLAMPDGSVLENDDDWDDLGRSRLQLTLGLTGGYELGVTSYDPGASGGYVIEVRNATAAPFAGAPNRTFALLVGISDYGGRASDLEHTAEDARHLGDALVERAGLHPDDTVLLVDSQATIGNVRQALTNLAGRMTVADELIVFYSGHGNRVRRDSYQPADPDAVDETLTLYDDDLLDDELAALLDPVPGRVLLVLDSCFAGGFAKDVISAPGRMGLFSSEEDVTSSVADKFRAGGFLAAFFVDALEDGWADGGDGYLTTLELSHYLHERYRSDVKGGGPEDFVRTEGPQLGYQRLVVDRGSLSPADVLFRIRPDPGS